MRPRLATERVLWRVVWRSDKLRICEIALHLPQDHHRPRLQAFIAPLSYLPRKALQRGRSDTSLGHILPFSVPRRWLLPVYLSIPRVVLLSPGGT